MQKPSRKHKVSTTLELMAGCSCMNRSKHHYSQSVRLDSDPSCATEGSLRDAGDVLSDLCCGRCVTPDQRNNRRVSLWEAASMLSDGGEVPVLISQCTTSVVSFIILCYQVTSSFPNPFLMWLMRLDKGGQAAPDVFGKSIRPQIHISSLFFKTMNKEWSG